MWWSSKTLRIPLKATLTLRHVVESLSTGVEKELIVVERPNYYRGVITVEALGSGGTKTPIRTETIRVPLQFVHVAVSMQATVYRFAAGSRDSADARAWFEWLFSMLEDANASFGNRMQPVQLPELDHGVGLTTALDPVEAAVEGGNAPRPEDGACGRYWRPRRLSLIGPVGGRASITGPGRVLVDPRNVEEIHVSTEVEPSQPSPVPRPSIVRTSRRTDVDDAPGYPGALARFASV